MRTYKSLDAWVRATHTRRQKLADDVGVSVSLITMLMRDKASPSLKLALRIYAYTRGAVPLRVLLKRTLESASPEAVRELEAVAAEKTGVGA